MPIIRDIPNAKVTAPFWGRFLAATAICLAVLATFHKLASGQAILDASSETAPADGSKPTIQTVLAPSLGQRYPDAQGIFHCTFDGATQVDIDGWPSGWTRQRDANHPPYVDVRLDGVTPAPSGRSLRMSLDGGGAAAYSSAIPVRSAFNYVFECQVQTEGLVYNTAYLSVTFFDAQNNVVERQVSSPVGLTTTWTRLRIGPVTPTCDAAQHAIIGLHLEPGEHADLQGKAWFADVWAGRLPRIVLQVGGCHHLYVDPQQPEVVCTVSGFTNKDAAVEFQLLDVQGHELKRERVSLGAIAAVDSAKSSRSSMGDAERNAESTPYTGSITWKPPISEVGFYRVRAGLVGQSDAQPPCQTTLALIREEPYSTQGEFGWTLPRGEKPLTLEELPELAQIAGIHWLKFPMWDGPDDPQRANQLAAFVQRLKNDHREVIGLLADPPMSVRKRLDESLHLSDSDPLCAAQIFSADPELWYPSLEPILSRLALLVHTWQLGKDDDTSFVNYPQLSKSLGQVHKQLGHYGQESQLGVAWSWLQELPTGMTAGDFVSLWIAPPTSNEQRTVYLERTQNTPGQRWVAVQPHAPTGNDATDRACDLVQQILVAKMHGAQKIFLPELCSTEHGLLNDDGSVGELFLPWQTTTQALAGTNCLGSLQLPQGSFESSFYPRAAIGHDVVEREAL